MSIATQIVLTVIPNGFDQAGRRQASILISPRVLVSAPDVRMPIRNHAWFADWPATVRAAGELALICGNFQGGGEARIRLRVVSQVATITTATGSMWTDMVAESHAAALPPARAGRIQSVGELAAFQAQRASLSARAGARAPEQIAAAEDVRRSAQAALWDRLRELDISSQVAALSAGDRRARADLEDPKEFHRRVAAVLGYQALARELGLVLDVELSDPLPDAEWIRMEAPNLPALAGGQQLRPRTALDRTGGAARFCARLAAQLPPLPGVPLPDQGMLSGFGSLTAARQIHLHRLTTECTELDPAAMSRHDGRQPLPSLPDQMHILNPHVHQVLQAWSERAAALGSAGDSSVLFADDLVAGMAVELKEATAGTRWRSLCRREGAFVTHVNGQASPALPQPPHSVGVQIGEQGSTSGRAAPDVFLRLDGWSLVCTRPGSTLDEARGRAIAENSFVRAELAAVDGSLPRFRYGHRYECRARAIDLAGHDMAATVQGAPDDSEMLQFTFKRSDPVKEPMIVPTVLPTVPRDGPRDPQGPTSVAVGYVFPNPDGPPIDHTREEVRYLLPPKASPSTTELSGSLDGEDNFEAFRLLKRIDSLPPKVFADGLPVEHLPDPHAVGVHFEELPGAAQLTRAFGGRWPSPRPVRLVVKPGAERHSLDRREELVTAMLRDPGNAGSVDNPLGRDVPPDVAGVSVTVRVRPGFRHTVTVRSDLGPHEQAHRAFDTSRDQALLQLSATERSAPEARLLRLQLATPAQTFSLAHPVVSPLFRPRLLAALPPLAPGADGTTEAKRGLGADDLELGYRIFYHGPTTGRLQLGARWQERDANGGATLVEVVVAQREANHLAGEQRVVPLFNLKLLEANLTVRHRFDDGKYRRVDYFLRAGTSFGEYYTETNVSNHALAGNEWRVHVLASKPPLPPEVVRVVPTFRTVALPPGVGAATHARLTGLRIYLAKPWYSSGDGELLAVLERSDAGVSDTRKASKSVSVWANDVIRVERACGKITSLVFRHEISPGRPFPDGLSPVPLPSSGQFELERGDERGLLVKLNAFEPRPDEDGLACDVDVAVADPENDGVFYPFVRLALARFQRHAVTGAALSEIVFVTFVQLPPQRTLQVVESSGRLSVVVRGRGLANRMCFQLVPRGRGRIPTSGGSQHPIESSDAALLLPPPSDWVSSANEVWTFDKPMPSGDHWLIITEREELGGSTRLTTLCKLEVG